MRTIVLTEAEYHKVKSFLRNALSSTSWLGGKVAEDTTPKEHLALLALKYKIDEAKRDA